MAARFKSGEVAAVYSSQTTRTLHTAWLIGRQVGAPVQVAQACADTAAIASFLLDLSRRFRPALTVVLVSHSNVIPHFLIKAGLAKECWPELGVLSTFFDPEPRIDLFKVNSLQKKQKLTQRRRAAKGIGVKLRFLEKAKAPEGRPIKAWGNAPR